VINAYPGLVPVYTPEVATIGATEGSLLLQCPPGSILIKTVDIPAQILVRPEIGPGVGLTVNGKDE
jgi:hypothetical protein